jgi:hypothetical protein
MERGSIEEIDTAGGDGIEVDSNVSSQTIYAKEAE